MQWFRRKNDRDPAAVNGAGDAGGAVGAHEAGDDVVAHGAMSGAAPPAAGQAASLDPERLREAIVERLRTVYDPEIPVNIYDIGLIYGLDVDPEGRVRIRMTLTSPMCPVAESLPIEVENKVAGLPGVADVALDLVWDPPWTPAMMTEEARLLLNIG